MRGRLKTSQPEQEEGTIDIDPLAMGVLIEESEDVHHDAMGTTARALDEMVESGNEARAHGDSTSTSLAK